MSSRPPSVDDLDASRKISDDQLTRIRSAHDIIDQAMRENRFGEFLLYGFAVAFVAVGVIAILHGIFSSGEGFVAIAGGIASALFIPAMVRAAQIRKQNLAIRLLEASLENAETSAEAAKAIRDAFMNIFGGKPE